MFIQTEATPNPATLKFLPGRTVLEAGTLEMRDTDEAAQSPLAERLFDINGVGGVFFGSRLHHGDQDGRRMAAAQAGDPRRHHGALHVGRAVRRRRRGRRHRAKTASSSRRATPTRSRPSRS